MRVSRILLVSILFLACGPKPNTHEHPKPLSVSEHEEHAVNHEANADFERGRIESNVEQDAGCVGQDIPMSSGGENIRVMRPCWTRAEQNATYTRSVKKERRAASDHRKWATQLLKVEAQACSALSEEDRKTSPFEHRSDILSVEEYRESNELMGARITFRKVKGLSAEWLSLSMRCHQARAATLGYAKDFMPHCPLTVNQISISVVEKGGTVVATIRSADPIAATEIYGRALRSGSE